MGLQTGEFGKPELVEMSAREAEKIFQGYAKAKPSKEDAYAAARAFLRGQKLDAWQKDLVASAVAEPIQEMSGVTVLGSRRLLELLGSYEAEAKRGDLWRLTWHGLLYSYFNYVPSLARDESTQAGWEALRAFLERTWPLIDQQVGRELVPDWIGILRKEHEVLTAAPVEKYSRAYLRGETEVTDRLAADLGIPPSSWFWHALVLDTVERATDDTDAEFRGLLPRLLNLIQGKPGFRDEALEAILIRYHACKGSPQDEQLRDYVCQSTVWKNPKLKAAGIATAWNRVPDTVWEMVLGWVNKQNLEDFFGILAARNNADEGRLDFWSKYLTQVTWTRLVFGRDTMILKRENPNIRDLIAREEGAYAQLTGKPEVDAFMMRIGSYLFIEFSKKPNACYVYQSDQLPFEPYLRHYDGGTSDLAAGYNTNCALRIVHREGWASRAEADLRRLGISPDRPDVRRAVSTGAATASTMRGRNADTGVTVFRKEASASDSDVPSLRALLSRFPGALMDDLRKADGGGRLWIKDPDQRVALASRLEERGFKWANSRQAWYYVER
ncbi:EH signature domain-containing protein [Paralcaligenes ureilyticus]|nr:EH signature domain-containing protein [Paralcaligenes ureilyticus]